MLVAHVATLMSIIALMNLPWQQVGQMKPLMGEEDGRLYGELGETEEYRLKPGDVVGVQVWREEAMSGDFAIGLDGTIRIPLLGKVRAAYLTQDELEQELKQRLSKRLKRPRVFVTIRQYGTLMPMRFYVLGEVYNRGLHMVKEPGIVTLSDAIGMAGGFTEDADATRVRLVRTGMTIIVDMESALEGSALGNHNLALESGDVIYVPKLAIKRQRPIRVTVLGLVPAPGTHLIRDDSKLTDLFAVCGAPLPDADTQAQLFRQDEPLEVIDLRQLLEKGDLTQNLPLKDGDILLIPRAIGRVITVIGKVKFPGVIEVDRPEPLLRVLGKAGGVDGDHSFAEAIIYRKGGSPESVKLKELLDEAKFDLNVEINPGDVVLVKLPGLFKVTITGEVEQPGVYVMSADDTLMDLIVKAGGTTERADLFNILLQRNGEEQVLDLTRFLIENDLSQNVTLQEGDAFNIPRQEKILVLGAVGKAGSLYSDPKEPLTLLEAIDKSGGLTEKADPKNVRLIRWGEAEIIDVSHLLLGDLSDNRELQPGDIVVVPSKGEIYIFGAVSAPGKHTIRDGDTLFHVLANAGGPVMGAADLKETFILRVTKGRPTILRVDASKLMSRKKFDVRQNPLIEDGDVIVVPFKKPKQRFSIFDAMSMFNSLAWVLNFTLLRQ